MNNKTAKLLRKYASRKGLELKDLKAEWLSSNEFKKDSLRQEYLSELSKK
ncbi:MAG: hypothetical protein SFU98_22680 [Leptospiraceae bacterium]|nr:hypothetical protein [Leptospiraceae bacterium]